MAIRAACCKYRLVSWNCNDNITYDWILLQRNESLLQRTLNKNKSVLGMPNRRRRQSLQQLVPLMIRVSAKLHLQMLQTFTCTFWPVSECSPRGVWGQLEVRLAAQRAGRFKLRTRTGLQTGQCVIMMFGQGDMQKVLAKACRPQMFTYWPLLSAGLQRMRMRTHSKMQS